MIVAVWERVRIVFTSCVMCDDDSGARVAVEKGGGKEKASFSSTR